MQVELDLVQFAAFPTWWFEPAGDPLETLGRGIEDELDWFHALSGPASGCASTTDKLCELSTQLGMHVLDEAKADTPTLTRREAQARVHADRERDTSADHFAIAAGMRRAVVRPGCRIDLRSLSEGDWVLRHATQPI